MPPHGAGVEGLPVTSPSSRDKPSRPGRSCPGRSSSRALHLDRPGPARTPDGRDDGEVTTGQATIHATRTDATPQAIHDLLTDPRADHNTPLPSQPGTTSQDHFGHLTGHTGVAPPG